MPVVAQVRQRLARRIAGEISLSDNPGRIMRKWREMFHIPQIQLAESLGVSPSVISDYESGRRQSPGTKTIKRFVENIITLDEQNGGQVVNAFQRLMGVEIPTNIILDISEFNQAISAQDFLEYVRGEVVAGEELLNREILGYTVVDTAEALNVLSSLGFLKLFEATGDRALILANVSTGRSPLVAVKGEMKPSLFVLHGVEEIDYLAIELAKKERVPLAISRMESIDVMLKRLQELRKHAFDGNL
ncbi:MAG: helix-turn-helix domain-containing protein [Candidatus Thorarchaeota archaeon]